MIHNHIRSQQRVTKYTLMLNRRKCSTGVEWRLPEHFFAVYDVVTLKSIQLGYDMPRTPYRASEGKRSQ